MSNPSFSDFSSRCNKLSFLSKNSIAAEFEHVQATITTKAIKWVPKREGLPEYKIPLSLWKKVIAKRPIAPQAKWIETAYAGSSNLKRNSKYWVNY